MKKLSLVNTDQHQSANPAPSAATPVLGQIIDLPERGRARLALPDGSELSARMTSTIAQFPPTSLLGREALVIFAGNDPGQPIVCDLIGDPEGFADGIELQPEPKEDLGATVDGKEVVIRADERLELRCGKASIIIDADGKISIKGAHLYNRATGPIRIKGGHVDIN